MEFDVADKGKQSAGSYPSRIISKEMSEGDSRLESPKESASARSVPRAGQENVGYS